MPQLNQIANVQNRHRANPEADRNHIEQSSDSKPDFELEPKRRNGKKTKSKTDVLELESQNIDEESQNVETLIPKQLGLIENQQATDVPEQILTTGWHQAASQESLAVNLSAAASASKTAVAQRDLPSPPPLSNSRQLIEVAASAFSTGTTDPGSEFQVDSQVAPLVDSVEAVTTPVVSKDAGRSGQAEMNSLPLSVNAPIAEVGTRPNVHSAEIAKGVTETVADGLVQQVELTENGANRKMVLQLHPAELGQVTLQVDWENETLKATILTNEAAATEVLNQNKHQLVTALAENGISFDSLDVAYQDARNEQPEDHENNPFSKGSSDGDRAEVSVPKLPIPNSSTTMVDIVV